MLDNKGFDLWADGYDETVGLSDEEDSYPFAGYKNVLAIIYDIVCAGNQAAGQPTFGSQAMGGKNAAVLDIGFGTGTLTTKLYGQGCEIYGQDFSERMVRLAGDKMEGAHLYQGDFAQGLAEPLLRRTYDFIIATYSLHHLTDEGKIELLRSMRELLSEDGMILIGDVAFENRAELEACRREAGEEWDDEEIYFVVDELRRVFPDIRFEKVSHCAGILSLGR